MDEKSLHPLSKTKSKKYHNSFNKNPSPRAVPTERNILILQEVEKIN